MTNVLVTLVLLVGNAFFVGSEFALIASRRTVIEPLAATLSVTVQNITDEDPPFARLDLNYDPFTGNPLGRVIKVGFKKTF